MPRIFVGRCRRRVLALDNMVGRVEPVLHPTLVSGPTAKQKQTMPKAVSTSSTEREVGAGRGHQKVYGSKRSSVAHSKQPRAVLPRMTVGYLCSLAADAAQRQEGIRLSPCHTPKTHLTCRRRNSTKRTVFTNISVSTVKNMITCGRCMGDVKRNGRQRTISRSVRRYLKAGGIRGLQ